MSWIVSWILLSLAAGKYTAVSSFSSRTCTGTPEVLVFVAGDSCAPIPCGQDPSSSGEFIQVECVEEDWETFSLTKFVNASAPIIVQQIYSELGCQGARRDVIATLSGLCQAGTNHTLQSDGSLLIQRIPGCTGEPTSSFVLPADGSCRLVTKYSVMEPNQKAAL